jgi:hypothetical protein
VGRNINMHVINRPRMRTRLPDLADIANQRLIFQAPANGKQPRGTVIRFRVWKNSSIASSSSAERRIFYATRTWLVTHMVSIINLLTILNFARIRSAETLRKQRDYRGCIYSILSRCIRGQFAKSAGGSSTATNRVQKARGNLFRRLSECARYSPLRDRGRADGVVIFAVCRRQRRGNGRQATTT